MFYDLLEQSLPFYNMLKHQVRRIAGSQQPHYDPPLPVPENKKILVWVGDELLPRDSAKVCTGNIGYAISNIILNWSHLISSPQAPFVFLIIFVVKVSVLDSVVQGGDAVWEGLRIYDGKVFKLEEHLDRCSNCSVFCLYCHIFSSYDLCSNPLYFFF